ncbi:carbohydrate sulfotransferase 1 [Astyanax mexicanus]|uniref:Sulfotransferase n=1 Tax=Astyanax mexicanus TaxID=7994 RepID=A0A8B9GSE0_ASTMX|nr:carbohydrate sulfotransferase 1 [Astyanax mexicanus]KAG9273520.1 carbohydrate sulfotransferase 1-like [Astyanax mexicanus]
MQCSWKAVILLALASIAIQYTAIRTFTSKPFQLCPVLIPQNCGLGAQETDTPFERGCDEYAYFNAFNASRKTHVLVLATTRSGSSFVGQLLNQHSDIFYLFEPLYHVQTALIPRLSHSRNTADRRVMLGASRDLLRSLYGCDLHFLESYIKPAPTNHTTDKLFRRGASRALCSQPVCDAFSPAEANVEEGDCVKKCATLNMTLAAESCRDKRHVAIKIVRVPEIGDLRALVEDPRLNLKVIQLVRDPRGILASRIETFRDTYRLWRIWRATGRKPYNLDLTQLTVVCEDFLSSVSTGLSHPYWLKGKYMVVRYEDLARNPLQKTKDIYDYLGLSMDKNVVDWIQANTRGSNELSAKHKYGTVRDSAANAESWRLKLSFDMVDYTQTVCQKILHTLGYKSVKSAEELKNMSLSLVADKVFVPFL